MPRVSSYTYDPSKGEWSKSVTENNDDPNVEGSDSLTSSNPNKNSSVGAVEQEKNSIEINTLSGSLNFIVTEETIKLKAGDTVELVGLGKYLSGLYYVQDVERQVSNSGYSHSATLIKTDFGKSLKLNSSGNEQTKQEKVDSPPTVDNAKRTYTVQKGDTLWSIANKLYGNGAQYPKIFEANTNILSNPNIVHVGQVLIIP